MKTTTTQMIRKVTRNLAALLAIAAAPGAFAANQTWTNAPSSSAWTNAANWNGNGVPGAVNSTTTADFASFVSPIALAGYGGAGQPITNDSLRGIRGFLFDTANCGAYVFGSSLADNHLEIMHLGDISVGPAVTNPITFNLGLRSRLPNSTDGRFDLTNNAVNPLATVFINVISNSSANTRPWRMFLGGSNTGTNTIARFDSTGNTPTPGTTGAILLDKVGTGTWILSGPNDLPQKTSAGSIARAQIIEGTLIVKDVASLGALSAANILVTNIGVLQIDGVTPQNLGFSLRNGGTIRMNGTGGINGAIVGNQAGLNTTLRTTSASDVFTVGGASVVSGGLADSVLHFAGPGTIQLNSANTFAGIWSFDSGTNQILNPNGLGTAVKTHIAAGTILDSSTLGFYSLTTADISANGSGTVVGSTASTIDAGAAGTFDFGTKSVTLTFTPTSFSGDTTHPALYISQGTLSVGGNAYNINNASGTPLGAGTYRLIQQASGSISASGAGIALVTGSGVAAGHIPEIVISGGNVNLVISPYVAKNLTWQGGSSPDNIWDRLTTANWTDGSATTFNNSDAVTFNAVGAAFPNINVSGSMIPGAITVDATTAYSFNGGEIAGTAALTKKNTGDLVFNAVNTYRGGTVVSNGTLRVGIENAVPSAGSGDVAVYSPGIIDLNGFNNMINGLNGNGTVDINSGGASILTIGDHNNSGTFSGLLRNTSGSLGVTKIGNGTQTLTAANTYTNTTTVNAGTLRVDNYLGLGSGASPVVVNGGTLNVTTNVLLASLSGTGGTVANNSSANTVTVTLQGNGTYNGVIANGSGGGRVGLYVKSGTTQLNGISTYTNGTIVASGATLAVGAISPGASGAAGTGGITVSNESIITLPTTLAVAANIGNNITAANGALVRYWGASTGNGINGQFNGSASNTNVLSGTFSLGGVNSFSNFLGTVVVSNNASIRFFNAAAGGNNTTFLVQGGIFTRDANTVSLGALLGTEGGIYGPSQTPFATYLIGAKGLSTTFSGIVQGSNNIVKVGVGSLTLNGVSYQTNTVTLPDPFEPTNIVAFTLVTNRVTHLGNTTVSNGTLIVVAPNNLTNSPVITLAGTGAVLDATQIGYATNMTMIDFNSVEQVTNTVVVTTATVQILTNQALNGLGSILGSVNTDLGSTMNVGLAGGIGTLTVSGGITLNGTVNMELNRTNTPNNSDRLVAASFGGSGATLNVTNIGGATLLSGSTYQLFSGPVTAFTTVNLPTANTNGTINYTWQNNLATSGSITLLTGLNPNPTSITSTVGSTNLTLSWPADYKGWTLQVQTNALSVGISGNWVNVANSAATNQVIVPLVKTNQTVFYRLTLPLP